MSPTRSRRARTRARTLSLSSLLALFFLTPTVHASTLMALDVPSLTRGSDLVVRGKVMGTTSRWLPGTGRIVTDVRLAVDEALMGAVAHDSLTLVQPGGTVDGIHQQVSGSADLWPGEEVVLFLARGLDGLHVVGLSQGRFRVVPAADGEVRLGTSVLPEGLTLLDPLSLQPVSGTPRTLDLQTLREQVRAAGGAPSQVRPARTQEQPEPVTPPAYHRTRAPPVDGASEGHCLWWTENSTLTFHQQQCLATEPDCAARQAAVGLALKSWDDVLVSCGSLRVTDGPATASREVGYSRNGPNENVVLLRDGACTQPAQTDCWAHAPSTVALTTVTYEQRTGRLLDADIELNAVYFSSTPTQDLQGTMTHELGHALGLDHSSDPASTMYATSSAGPSATRAIDADSRQAMCDIYPPGAPARDCIDEDEEKDPHGCAASAAGAAPVISGLLALLVLLRQRARRD
ncbi:matrixin family metalloprotease [Pyxidicoccus xibeiensis]|uniref:matrixin family metalloprotease n=1 Tax=Pyxidicoccus xibeiensis TaxID=2906759 RepID=UPI0020A73887|nr:matrixin family metalloprotease [Pyxidicoccus xibeiensis]MCP3142412.1 matrixin family metalloprotease [Pyxidicoccus xibeiensis]